MLSAGVAAVAAAATVVCYPSAPCCAGRGEHCADPRPHRGRDGGEPLYSDIIGKLRAPYMNTLAGQGALLTSSYAVTHPSEPNYMALFAGSTFGLSSDTCPVSEGSTANLGFGVARGRRHVQGLLRGPALDRFDHLHVRQVRAQALAVDQLQQRADRRTRCRSRRSRRTTRACRRLSFVIPNLKDDMHDGTITQADTWLNKNLSAYATWAQANNSLLIVTWDEDDYTESNQIPTHRSSASR